jgi:hypothetical protein
MNDVNDKSDVAMNEQWKPVYGTKNYRDMYEVSNYGKVRNKHTRCNLKPSTTHTVHLGQNKREYINRLVAEVFVHQPSRDHNHVININGIYSDNKASNLKWSRFSRVKHKNNIIKGKLMELRNTTDPTTVTKLCQEIDHINDSTPGSHHPNKIV